MRQSPTSSPNTSSLEVNIPSPASWLYSSESPKDTEITNKSCSLNRLNIKSNYWKIPDNNMNLTLIDIKKQSGRGNDTDPMIAISSGNKLANLFIYQLDTDENFLTHNNTISLPNIHSMKWVPNSNEDSSLLQLATGNSGGYAHLLSIPDPDSFDENAEIIKKFNHKKYLKSHTPARIEKLDFLTNNSNASELVTLYQGNLFRWDINSARSKPVTISTIRGIRNFDIIPSSSQNSCFNSTIAISGDFGVSLFDTRQSEFRIPSAYSNIRKDRKGYRLIGANVIKWSSYNENVFALAHLDGVVRLWDVRKQEFFGQLDGHCNKLVTSIEWNDEDLFTGAKDGNIIHWDLSNTTDNLLNCTLKEGLNSIQFNPHKNELETKVSQRQCGTILPASNTNIIGMASIPGDNDNDCKVLSIDGSSFFGVHSKIYEAINLKISSEKLYYTSSDVSLLLKSEREGTSNDTLVAEEDSEKMILENGEGTKPLEISRNPTITTIREQKNELASIFEYEGETEAETEADIEAETEDELKEENDAMVDSDLTRYPSLTNTEHIHDTETKSISHFSILSPANENISNETLLHHDSDVSEEFEFSNEVSRYTYNSENSLNSSPNSGIPPDFSDNDSVSTNLTVIERESELFEKHEPFDFEFDVDLLIELSNV